MFNGFIDLNVPLFIKTDRLLQVLVLYVANLVHMYQGRHNHTV